MGNTWFSIGGLWLNINLGFLGLKTLVISETCMSLCQLGVDDLPAVLGASFSNQMKSQKVYIFIHTLL